MAKPYPHHRIVVEADGATYELTLRDNGDISLELSPDGEPVFMSRDTAKLLGSAFLFLSSVEPDQ